MSGPVDDDQTFRYRFPVKNASGVLANAGTVTVTVTLPDGTTTNPTAVNTSTGLYDIAYTTSQVGRHQIRAVATGGVLGSEVDVWEDVFVVEEQGQQLISVDEASDHLRASGVITSDADREQLRRLCLAATDSVERDLGRTFTRRTVTEVYDGDCNAIILRSAPALSVTSVTESGTVLAATAYQLDSAKGLLRRGQYGTETWASGRYQNVSVTYVVGYTNPPRVVREVALNLVQAMWQESQQASHPLLDESGALPEGAFAGLLSGLPAPLRNAYNKLRRKGIA